MEFCVSLDLVRNKYIADNFNSDEAVQSYQADFLHLKNQYINTPRIISLETYAKCDAKCDFCPYVSIERLGTKMSDDLIAKIVSDIGDLDKNIPLFMTIARINEPFLDKRIFDIAKAIHKVAPQAQFIYFSNGSPLVSSMLDRFEQLPATFCLSLSLNDHRRARYEEIMQIPFERALERFDSIHKRKAKGRMPFWTRITKVADNNLDDEEFIAYVADRWPLFDVSVYRRATWSGAVDTMPSAVPDAGCAQWFTVGFYADGTDPFCVMDADGKFSHGDISKQHLLEIYNHPFRKNLRAHVSQRKSVEYCKACSLMS
jgi:Iron-sulfur cluster-binding domain